MIKLLNQITVGDLQIVVADGAPTANDGLKAAVGSLLLVFGTGSIYLKTDEADTAWMLTSIDARQLGLDLDQIRSNISGEIARATAAEGVLTSDLASEIARATGAESQLASDLAAEVSRAQSAEAGLARDLAAEVTRATSAEGVLTSDLASEVSRAQAAEAVIAGDLAQEVSDRQAAISAEQSARQSADSQLASDLATEVSDRTAAVSAEQAARQAADSAEEAARMAADSALSGRLDVIEGTGDGSIKKAVADLVNGAPAVLDTLKELSDALGADANFATTVANHIGDEAQARQAADASLASDLASEVSARQTAVSQEAADRASADSSEAAARLAADQALQTAIDSEVSARQSAVSTEQAAREAGDSAEQSRAMAAEAAIAADLATEVSDRSAAMSAEQSARQSADSDLGARIDSESSSRQSADAGLQSQIDSLSMGSTQGLSEEIARAQAAESTLQGNIDSEASTRANADSQLQSNINSEASTRQSADTALGARIDALATTSLTDVSEANKVDGDLFQWDATSGKWKNVAPINHASSTTTGGGGGSEVLASSYTTTQEWNGSSGTALGTTYKPDSNKTITRVGLKVGRTGAFSGMTAKARIYSVSEYIANGVNNYPFSPSDFTLVAESINSASDSDLVLYPEQPNMVQFNFAGAQLAANQYYVIWVEVDGVFPQGGGNYLAPAYAFVGGQNGANAHYKQLVNGFFSGMPDLVLGYEIYEGTAGAPPQTVATVGVIKTNSDGQLDDSFLAHDVDFGGHKLSGVSSPVAGTDAANKDYVDGQVSAEQSAREAAVSSLQSGLSQEISDRQSAVSSEASARQSADSAIQTALDNEVSARQSAISSEQSARESANAALSGRLDVVEGTGEGSIKKAVADLVAAAPAVLDTLKELADAIGDDPNFATTVANQIGSEAARAEAAEAVIASNLASEVTRAQGAEATLTSDLASEVSRAQAAESGIAADLASEVSRAQGAEGTLTTNLASEVSRAQAAEASIASDLAAETSRAETAEAGLASDIAAETSRAQAAESAEQTARQNADTTLQSNIDAEASARAAAVSAEQSRAEAAEALKLNKAGDTMSGDLNMGGNKVVNVSGMGVGTLTPETVFEVVDSTVKFSLKGGSASTVGVQTVTISSMTPAANSVGVVKVFITGKDSASDKSVAFERTVRIMNNGGTVTLGSTQSDYTDKSMGMSQADCGFSVSGSDVHVTVTGFDSKTIAWKCLVQKMS